MGSREKREGRNWAASPLWLNATASSLDLACTLGRTTGAPRASAPGRPWYGGPEGCSRSSVPAWWVARALLLAVRPAQRLGWEGRARASPRSDPAPPT